MKKVRTAAVGLGIYAGLLGIEHGVFEILQGNTRPVGIMINAIGFSCQPEEIWHACFPAMTIVPSFLISGILAVVVGFGMVLTAVRFAQRKGRGWYFLLLAALLLLVGGGFVPVFIGITAGITVLRMNSGMPLWKNAPFIFGKFFAWFWPRSLVLLAVWFLGSWIMGYFFGAAMLRLGGSLFFVFDLGLPILIAVSAFAAEAQIEI